MSGTHLIGSGAAGLVKARMRRRPRRPRRRAATAAGHVHTCACAADLGVPGLAAPPHRDPYRCVGPEDVGAPRSRDATGEGLLLGTGGGARSCLPLSDSIPWRRSSRNPHLR